MLELLLIAAQTRPAYDLVEETKQPDDLAPNKFQIDSSVRKGTQVAEAICREMYHLASRPAIGASQAPPMDHLLG